MTAANRANWISIVVFVSVVIAGCRSAQMASTVNPATIRSITIGMTEQEVVAILGQPLQIRPWGEGAVIYDYAIPGFGGGASLWIYFQKGSVRTVHGKRYPILGDDYAVYEAREDWPTAFERPDFESTFSRVR